MGMRAQAHLPATPAVDADEPIARPPRRRHRPSTPYQRVRVIEFLWFGESGVQPVLFVERQWLQ